MDPCLFIVVSGARRWVSRCSACSPGDTPRATAPLEGHRAVDGERCDPFQQSRGARGESRRRDERGPWGRGNAAGVIPALLG